MSLSTDAAVESWTECGFRLGNFKTRWGVFNPEEQMKAGWEPRTLDPIPKGTFESALCIQRENNINNTNSDATMMMTTTSE